MLRKFLVVVLAATAADTPLLHLNLGVFLLCVCLTIHVLGKPFFKPILTGLEGLSLSLLVVVLNLAFMKHFSEGIIHTIIEVVAIVFEWGESFGPTMPTPPPG